MSKKRQGNRNIAVAVQLSNKLSIMSHSVLANNKIPPVLVARYLTKSEIVRNIRPWAGIAESRLSAHFVFLFVCQSKTHLVLLMSAGSVEPPGDPQPLLVLPAGAGYDAGGVEEEPRRPRAVVPPAPAAHTC